MNRLCHGDSFVIDGALRYVCLKDGVMVPDVGLKNNDTCPTCKRGIACNWHGKAKTELTRFVLMAGYRIEVTEPANRPQEKP